MTPEASALFWQLRLAAAKIDDDTMRQLYLNALAELVRRISSRRCFGQAGTGHEPPRQIPVWEDSASIRYDIALAERRGDAE